MAKCDLDKEGFMVDGHGQRAAFWPCDPDKNKSCLKTGCFKRGGPCKLTTRTEYAISDSKPLFFKAGRRGRKGHFE
jgi:hypothetical protein